VEGERHHLAGSPGGSLCGFASTARRLPAAQEVAPAGDSAHAPIVGGACGDALPGARPVGLFRGCRTSGVEEGGVVLPGLSDLGVMRRGGRPASRFNGPDDVFQPRHTFGSRMSARW